MFRTEAVLIHILQKIHTSMRSIIIPFAPQTILGDFQNIVNNLTNELKLNFTCPVTCAIEQCEMMLTVFPSGTPNQGVCIRNSNRFL
jgi:hypothetical protein